MKSFISELIRKRRPGREGGGGLKDVGSVWRSRDQWSFNMTSHEHLRVNEFFCVIISVTASLVRPEHNGNMSIRV